MNELHRVVWNAVRQAWVAVPETAAGRTKSRSQAPCGRHARRARWALSGVAAAAASLFGAGHALAADECGAEAAGPDTVTCSAASYAAGINYTGSDGLLLNLNNPSMVVQAGASPAGVSITGAAGNTNTLAIGLNSLVSVSGTSASTPIVRVLDSGNGIGLITMNAGSITSDLANLLLVSNNAGTGNAQILITGGTLNSTASAAAPSVYAEIAGTATGNASVSMTGGSIVTAGQTAAYARVSNVNAAGSALVSITGATVQGRTATILSQNDGLGTASVSLTSASVVSQSGSNGAVTALVTNAVSAQDASVSMLGGSISASGAGNAGIVSQTLGTGRALVQVTTGTINAPGNGAEGIVAVSSTGTYSVNLVGANITGGSGNGTGVHVIAAAGGTLNINSTTTINAGSPGGVAIRDGDFDRDGIDEVGGASAITTAGTINGAIALGGGADTLNVTGGAINGDIRSDGSAALNFTLGSGSFTYGPHAISGMNSVTMTSGNVQIDGTIAGNTLTVNGGTMRLNGANTYTGGTFLNGGVLAVSSDANLGNPSGALVFNSGTLQNVAAFTTGRAVTLNGTGGTFRTDADLTLSGAITGTGTLTKQGNGTLVLAGNNSYGLTTVSAGTLQVGNGGTSGTLGTGNVQVNTGATLAFNHSDTHTVSNGIFGGGSLTQAGTGTLVLTANNGYTGGTTIASGTLQLGNGGLNGTLNGNSTSTIVDNGSLVFNTAGGHIIRGAITGTGSVTQAGPGSMTLEGNSDYAGPTIILAGTLTIGNGGATGTLGRGDVTNNATLGFNRSDTYTVSNAISGTGRVSQFGVGTLILTGNNTYSGGTTINFGTLQVGNGGASGSLGTGAVTNNASLVFNRSDAITFANTISGTGSITQAGSGNVILTGANTYTGGTNVNAGTLSVNGSIVGDTIVNSGGRLGGNGSTGNITVNSGGTLAPGNSIGTLTANGNLTFNAGSIYQVETNPAGSADRVNTVGAGTLTINGGRVDVRAGGSGYARNTRYTILNSAGGRTGQFDAVSTDLTFLTPTLAYDGNNVYLDLQASERTSYADVAATVNQRNVANYLASFAAAPTNADASGLIQQVDNMTPEQARRTFDALSGSPHAAASQLASALGRNFSAALGARSDLSALRYANPPQDAPTTNERGLWVQAVGVGGHIDEDGNGPDLDYTSSGFVLGYDQAVDSRWLAGAAVGYNRSSWDADTRGLAPGSGKLESGHAGAYARYTGSGWRMRMDLTYAHHDFDTNRQVSIGDAAAKTAASGHTGREWGIGTQIDFPMQWGDWQVRPLVGARHARLTEDGFNENGAGAANLAVGERTMENTVVNAGVHLQRMMAQGRGALELRVVASHLSGDNDSPVYASLAGQAGTFTAYGSPLKRDALTLGTTFSGQLARNLTGYLDASYEYRGSGQTAYRLTAGARLAF